VPYVAFELCDAVEQVAVAGELAGGVSGARPDDTSESRICPVEIIVMIT
jgi:hypothetical protein